MPALSAADLIFSSEQANHNFNKTLGEIKRSTLSIHNRLTSILRDAEFAQSVATAYGRPLIANERCGSWYIDPEQKGGSAYFKSTDGHQSVWKFSSRRLNLHLLEIIGKHDGCIIIDSTRRGKRMPDALSKTIPIWCSVINRFLFPNEPQYHKLYTPPQAVSESENSQISALLPSFVKALQDLKIKPESIKQHISKPLRPIWVTPESHIAAVSTIFENFHPVICCTVSKRVAGGESSEGGYIQGAGDDTENWAFGLTPLIFWQNQQMLLSTPEPDLPDLIRMLVRRMASSDKPSSGGGGALTCVRPTSYLFITKIPEITAMPDKTGADNITIVLQPTVTAESTWLTSTSRIDVGVGAHKIGYRGLRTALPFIIEFVRKALFPENPQNTPPKDELMSMVKQQQDTSPELSTSLTYTESEPPTKLENSTPQNRAGKQSSPNFESEQSHPPGPGLDEKHISHADKHIIIACETGTDLSIGVGLAIVCLFFDSEGEILNSGSAKSVMNKDFVKSRLTWFATSMPHANPARGTLQSVNSFLMDHRRE